MKHPDAAPRPAVIHLRSGTYEAECAELTANGVVTFTGRMVVSNLQGKRSYETTTRSHRLRSGEWINWETADAVAA
jgi:hypothetical protein